MITIKKFPKTVYIGLIFLTGIGVNFAAYAEEDLSTYYPAPYGAYRYLQATDASSNNLADFSNTLTGNGLGITTTYLANAYTPGLFWGSEDNNPGIPKAGIWTWNGNRGNAGNASFLFPYNWPGDSFGSHLLFGTSSAFGTGVNQTRMVLSPKGYLGIGIDPSAATAYEPQSRLWVDNGFISVQNGPAWSSAQWPISYTSGRSAAMTIAGPHELDATATAMGVGDGYLGFGITSDSAAAPEGSKNAGWYFIRARDKFGEIGRAPEYPVVFKGGAPANSLYVSEEGNVFMGPANLTIPAPFTGVTVTSLANNQATNNLQVNDVYLRSINQWWSWFFIRAKNRDRGVMAASVPTQALQNETFTLFSWFTNPRSYDRKTGGQPNFYGTIGFGTCDYFFQPTSSGLYEVSAHLAQGAGYAGGRFEVYLCISRNYGPLEKVARSTFFIRPGWLTVNQIPGERPVLIQFPDGTIDEVLFLTPRDRLYIYAWNNSSTIYSHPTGQSQFDTSGCNFYIQQIDQF